MKRLTASVRIYIQLVDFPIAAALTLVFYWATRQRIDLLFIPITYFLVAGLGNWLKTKVKICNVEDFPWLAGIQWPPNFFIGEVFYDGWHWSMQLGPVWLGRTTYWEHWYE